MGFNEKSFLFYNECMRKAIDFPCSSFSYKHIQWRKETYGSDLKEFARICNTIICGIYFQYTQNKKGKES